MTLSLRLVRQGKSVGDTLRPSHGLQEVEAQGARLFVEQTPAAPPTWFSFISQFSLQPLTPLQSMSCGAVLFMDVTTDGPNAVTRTMALAFGGAWHALDPNSFERSFGLKVALNSISRVNLRNLDVATLDATTMQKRIQASRTADLGIFGIDVQRDLLRLAGGVPTDLTFARSLSGKDVLTLHTRTSHADVVNICERALELFGETIYRKDYAWIDYITPVQEQDRISHLDALAFGELASLVHGGASDLHLALPDILDPDEGHEIAYFGTGLKSGTKQTFLELAIEDYVSQLQAGNFASIADMTALKEGHEVAIVIDGKRDKDHRRRIYECFVYEVTDSGRTYVLFNGDWFAVDSQFHADIERDFKTLLAATPFIASTTSQSEREFIQELDQSSDFLNLDQVKISPASASGANLEPCDFLSRKKQFIHLKDGHSSAPISHLWNQGVVSAEAFVRDAEFRKKLRKEAIKRQRKAHKKGFEAILPDGRSKPTPSDYTVVFGILRSRHKKSGTLGLPFFSKVSLRATANRIQSMTYPLEVHLIEKLPKS